jgi:hypothetical protein
MMNLFHELPTIVKTIVLVGLSMLSLSSLRNRSCNRVHLTGAFIWK